MDRADGRSDQLRSGDGAGVQLRQTAAAAATPLSDISAMRQAPLAEVSTDLIDVDAKYRRDARAQADRRADACDEKIVSGGGRARLVVVKIYAISRRRRRGRSAPDASGRIRRRDFQDVGDGQCDEHVEIRRQRRVMKVTSRGMRVRNV